MLTLENSPPRNPRLTSLGVTASLLDLVTLERGWGDSKSYIVTMTTWLITITN